jgi:hypothetical protein
MTKFSLNIADLSDSEFFCCEYRPQFFYRAMCEASPGLIYVVSTRGMRKSFQQIKLNLEGSMKISRIFFAALATVSFSAFANASLSAATTGGVTPAGTVFSCKYATQNYCMQLKALVDLDADSVKKTSVQCQSQGGEWIDAACPTDQHIGTCTINQSELVEQKARFYTPLTVEVAERVCSQVQGTFSTTY